MSRPLRLEYPGALYHATSRGNGRSKIFRSSEDRTTFLTIDWLLAQFGKRKNRSQSRYRAFVLEGITRESPWRDLQDQLILGDATFVDTLTLLLAGKREKVLRQALTPDI